MWTISQKISLVHVGSLYLSIHVCFSVPYAWDEPTLAPSLTLSVQGGTSASYDMDKLEEGEKLYYQNFIYLAATVTFYQ